MTTTAPTNTLAPGIYRDRDGDTWAITADQRALQLSQRSATESHGFLQGAMPTSEIVIQARYGLNDAAKVASAYAPLTPLHLFGQEGTTA
ncbi:hypothetical protein PBI_FLOOF_35 [Microbacterium phage Floof]|uniref:Uncharacterized protein n=1 Tax=Microbacterium phage Floof TaxID=2201433 RepID=A0A2Z4Q439_9CAUD|nr:hypothetical protein PBI_FLOOF_35 [Microbacterium phage Floof]